jgi:hypothetical protein
MPANRIRMAAEQAGKAEWPEPANEMNYPTERLQGRQSAGELKHRLLEIFTPLSTSWIPAPGPG